ncbi:MAG TPA: ATP-binding protein, partial [Candidatus Paceibacterota bacterium]|nr:ATP-binding protein [Candidatus Paceibacterota bacterium]
PDAAVRAWLNDQAAETLFGFSAEEALGKEVHKLMVPPAQREAAMSEVAQFLEQAHGKVLGKLLSLTATHRDGRQIPIELSVAPIHLRSRHMAVGIVRDISERKRAEEVLRLKNVLLSSQQEASIDGILVVDENAQILSYNRRFVEMWRVPEELMAELKDEPVLKYVADQTADAEAFLRRVRDLYEHRDETGQDELTLADGRIIDRYSAPLFGAESRYYGRAWYFRDMSERRRLELQLRQAQKLEAVGQLAGGVAHDFNNILTAILLHLNLLQTDQKLAANVQAELKDLETEAQRAVSLTRQLLMFSRREVMRRQVFDLNSLVGTLLKMLCRVIGEHIKLEMSGASESMWIEADAGMVEQIIMNLCVNARDAMPTGGRISLQTQLLEFDATVYQRHAEARPGRFVCLKVSDTGCGMDAETLKRVFEPFFTTKEPGKGTGLGLATVYGIVKQHQGWVEVQSAVGHGTEFSIFLPACEHAPIPEAQPATSAPIPGGNETLLLVEDERSVRATAGRILQQLGYRVLEAGSAPEALQIWAQNQGNVDLLITDVVMPGGLSGLELAEQLLKQRMGLRAILLSGYSAEIAHWGIPNSEQIKFLAKPLSTRLLAQTVRECLDAKSKRAT